MSPDWEISPAETKRRLGSGEPVVLVDVRRPTELPEHVGRIEAWSLTIDATVPRY